MGLWVGTNHWWPGGYCSGRYFTATSIGAVVLHGFLDRQVKECTWEKLVLTPKQVSSLVL